MNPTKHWKCLLLKLLLLIGVVTTFFQCRTFAGTTFLLATSYTQPSIFYCISSNGVETPINIDQSAFSQYGTQEAIAADTNGNLFVAYSGDVIVKFTTNSASVFATGNGAPSVIACDNVGNLYGNSNSSVLRITTNGTSVYATGLSGLNSFCFDNAGNIYSCTGGQIIKTTPQGIQNVFADLGSLTINLGFEHNPPVGYSIAVDGQTNVHVAVSLFAGNSYDAICNFDRNGVFQGYFQEGIVNEYFSIAADESTNVIYVGNIYSRGFGVSLRNGFGAGFILGGVKNIYLAYTPVDEVLGIYLPSFSLQPSNQTAAAGNNVYLKSAAFGSLPISYQWFFNGTNLISGATNQNLTITNLNSNQSGQYTVVASNYLGTASSQPASLNVIPGLDISTVPARILYGGVGFKYSIQYINQYGPTNAPWTTLATVTLTNSPQYYPDYSAIGQPTRFYRILQLP